MKSFQWGENYLTGLLDVDEQHKVLVDLINQLSDYLGGDELVFDEIERIFNELVAYSKYHFSEEQEMMAQAGIDQRHLDSHIQVHIEFINELITIYSGLSPNNPDSAHYLLNFLINWLAYHILDTDKNMAKQIALIQSGLSSCDAYEKEERKSNSSTEPLLIALKDLFHQISIRNKQLLELNQSLEEKVAERTKELLNVNKHLEELSLTDVLTNLPNRRYAMQQLNLLWGEIAGDGGSLVCLMIDADHFKQVNDTYGHDAGDTVLCKLARTLQHSVRTDDIVCRLGGDEFLIICPNTDEIGGIHIANLVHQSVSQLKVIAGDGVWLGSISVGVAAYTPVMQTYEDLIKLADEGVYVAKKDGKNCVKTVRL